MRKRMSRFLAQLNLNIISINPDAKWKRLRRCEEISTNPKSLRSIIVSIWWIYVIIDVLRLFFGAQFTCWKISSKSSLLLHSWSEWLTPNEFLMKLMKQMWSSRERTTDLILIYTYNVSFCKALMRTTHNKVWPNAFTLQANKMMMLLLCSCCCSCFEFQQFALKI